MEPSTSPPICVFFDFRNFLHGLWSTDLNPDIDYRKLVDWLVEEVGRRSREPLTSGYDVRVYTAVRWRGTTVFEGDLERFLSGLELFLSGLERDTGFKVFRLPWRNLSRECPDCGARHAIFEEERVDTTIVADMVAMAARGEYRVAVLVSGDSDFIPAVETAHGFGTKVYVASWGREHGLSRELELRADDHLDLTLGVNAFLNTLSTDITPELEEMFLGELRAAEAHFARFGGYVGERHFIRFWRGGWQFPASVRMRSAILERMVSDGRIERHQVVRDDGAHEAIRIVAAPGDPSASVAPPTSTAEQPP